ncbi:hypothetical protein MJH12_13785, partial [bacterium]|nr:hypothetical protein [bacterium]
QYLNIYSIIQSQSKNVLKFEKYETEIIQLISAKNFQMAKSKLSDLKKLNPNSNYLTLSEELKQNEIGSKLVFVEECIQKAKRLRVLDEDDGNPYYQLQLIITLSQAGKDSIVKELWQEFNKNENYSFLMNYPEKLLEDVVIPMSQLTQKELLKELLLNCVQVLDALNLDSNGTKVIAMTHVIKAYDHLKDDQMVDSLLDKVTIKTEFFDANALQDLSLGIFSLMNQLSRHHSVQVQRLLKSMSVTSYPTEVAQTLVYLKQFDQAFAMITEYKNLRIADLALIFAQKSQGKLALECVNFLTKTEDENDPELQKVISMVSMALIKNNLLKESNQLTKLLIATSSDWDIQYLAYKVLNQQIYAVSTFRTSQNSIEARKILKSIRQDIASLYLDPSFIRSRVISIFALSKAYFEIGRYQESWDLLNASQLLLEKVPNNKDNLTKLKKPILLEICQIYSKFNLWMKQGKIRVKSLNTKQVQDGLKRTVLKMNRIFSRYQGDFIESALDIHNLAMYNLL